jgi:hypothetical protein
MLQVTLPSGRVEELYFADPKFHGHMIDVLIFVKQDGRLERTHRGTITKVDGHPCHFSMTIGESFVREQLAEIDRKMLDLDTLPPRRPLTAHKPRRRTQSNGRVTEGQGKFLHKRGPLVLTWTEVQVGDVISSFQSDETLKQFSGWRIASHKTKGRTGKIKLVSDSGGTETIAYSFEEREDPVQVIRG